MRMVCKNTNQKMAPPLFFTDKQTNQSICSLWLAEYIATVRRLFFKKERETERNHVLHL
jgi:hypothetical protein